ncbi:MAG: molybdopterin-guanine dinucleotide biosynthesis protein B [Desulfobacteraceae bacterium 4572_130]|nr:MAG: molybdopterin-guanine dinucleotide biosynthesis protein B [Desulfobacteraceae bacterium 4572_130]
MKPNIISIVGKSKSGKTTFLEKLIPELKKRGYKLGIVKHTHSKFEFDKKYKDSWRHKNAGASATFVVSSEKIAMVKDEKYESLKKIRKYLLDMDLIITEGFKKEKMPKIEIFRKNSKHKPLYINDKSLVAFVTDSYHKINVPVFGLNDIKNVADFIEINFIK